MREQAAVTVVEARAAVTVEVWRRQGQPKRSPAGAEHRLEQSTQRCA